MRWYTKEDNLELEIYLFENDAKFEKVKKTNGGRIYYLYFNSYEEKYFFWFQNIDETKDEEFIKRINNLINLSYNDLKKSETQIENENKNQVINNNNNILNNLGPLRGLMSNKKLVNINDIFFDSIITLIENDDSFKERLIKFLPKNQQNKEDLIDNLKSPQFFQCMKKLEKLLSTQECKSILISLDIFDNEIYSNSYDPIEAFVKMVYKKYKK